MKKKSVGDLLVKNPPLNKIKRAEYLDKGEYPIVDQSRLAIAGFSNNSSYLYKGRLPVIVFGDHTRVLKFVNFPFCIGADGAQALRTHNDNNIRYFYYALRNIDLPNYGYERHFKYLKKEIIGIPRLSTQQKIAAILSAYDDLIENNLRRIEILEEMAQALYREWFVHFRFPGHEKVRFVDSPLGKIPEGWDVKTVAELLAKVRRKKRVKRQDYQVKGPIPIVDQGKEEIGGYTNDINAAHKWPLPIIVFGDHTRVLKYVDFPFASGADGTQLLISNTPRMPILLFFHTLKAIDLSDYSYARHFKWLKEELVVVPSVETASSFSKKANLYIELASKLRNINLILVCTRDLLLPRLISGELDVSELDIDVSDLS